MDPGGRLMPPDANRVSEMEGMTVPQGLIELSARASEDWKLHANKRLTAHGCVDGGPVQHFTNGSGQTQIASFGIPSLPEGDERDPVSLQEANAAFAVACVNWVRQLIAGQQTR